MKKKLDINRPAEIRNYILSGLRRKRIDHQDIEDSVNEIYLRVHSSLRSKTDVEISEMNLSGFISVCINNYTTDLFRKKRPCMIGGDITDELAYNKSPELCMTIDFRSFFDKAQNDHDFMFLCQVMELKRLMNTEDVANELGLSLANLKTRIHRARKNLRVLDSVFYDEYIRTR